MGGPLGTGPFTRERKSTQRESNPHFRHGEPVGFHYIMGANVLIGLSKNHVVFCAANVPSEDDGLHSRTKKHRVGLEPTFPHYGCGVLAAERPVPVSEWDQTDLNRHLPG